ncbi:hypothetical protein HDV06_004212 [Boothiomyces sp. JEL0866]|nr:hypothetical protein HDV06_004212 [Boothiomyces sp. JEL0866]
MNRILIFKRFMGAAPKVKKPAYTGNKKDKIGDPRYIAIKKMLYDPAIKESDPEKQRANALQPSTAESPVYIGEDAEKAQIDLVERMWAIKKQTEHQEFIDSIKRRYTAMRKANEALEKLDKRLFEGTLQKNEVESFPRKLRIVTETPPLLGWDYEMDRHQ